MSLLCWGYKQYSVLLDQQEDCWISRMSGYGKQWTAKGFQQLCYRNLSCAQWPPVVRAPGTIAIPASETIRVVVFLSTAGIFDFGMWLVRYAIVISSLDPKQSSHSSAGKMLTHHHGTQQSLQYSGTQELSALLSPLCLVVRANQILQHAYLEASCETFQDRKTKG